MRPIIPILTAIVAIAGTGVGVLTNYSSSSPSISSILENNKKKWHGEFNSIREKLKNKELDVPEWNEDSWKKWTTRFDNVVPEEFKHSIVNDMWMPFIGETIASKADNMYLNVLISEVMNGKIQEDGEEYNKLVEAAKKNASDPKSTHLKKEINENPLNEKEKKEIYEQVLKNYGESKSQFKKIREEWKKKGKGDIPDWNEEVWKKSVAIFYMSMPDDNYKRQVAISELWKNVVYEAFAKEENSKNEEEFSHAMDENLTKSLVNHNKTLSL